MGKHTESVDTLVLQRVELHGPGWVFTPADFADLGTRAAIASALKRHKAAERIRLLGRGLYDVPRHHTVLGTLWPAIETVAQALERKDGLRLQPSGVYAANLLGLSEQVPAKVVFLTDGATRNIKVGPAEIQLKRTTPRHMAAAGRLSGLLIQAFRSLGPVHVTPRRIAQLRKRLPAAQRQDVLKDLALAPEWMHKHLREIARV
ncbi:MAG: hypothetical protein H7346_23920 [Burkholderiaceae bacterium]|nr:hypothetical protein [Burkholderiaceae bacterium]